MCEGGEGGVGPFKILRKHLRKEGKGVSAGRVEVSRDPVACVVCVVGVGVRAWGREESGRDCGGTLAGAVGERSGCQWSCS